MLRGEPPSLLTDADSTSIWRKNWVTVDLRVFPTSENFNRSLYIRFQCDHRLPCFPNCFWGFRGARVVRQNGALKANSCGRRSSCEIVSNPTLTPDKFAFPVSWKSHNVTMVTCTWMITLNNDNIGSLSNVDPVILMMIDMGVLVLRLWLGQGNIHQQWNVPDVIRGRRFVISFQSYQSQSKF